MASPAAALRSIFVDSALSVVKGAACITFKIPTGRSTKSVRCDQNHKGVLTIGPIKEKPSDEQIEHLKFLIDGKIEDDSKYRSFVIPRCDAESLYGESMYDGFKVPENVKLLRLVILEEWNINTSVHPVIASTKYLGRIDVEALKFHEKKELVDIKFSVHPLDILGDMNGATAPICQDEVVDKGMMPPKSRVLPPSGAEDTTYEQTQSSVTPWEVDFGGKPVDYDKLIDDFGCSKITKEQIERVERLTGKAAHKFLRRQIFFSHRDLDLILDAYEKGTPFYIYTGRGPSSGSFHLGHLIPFLFTQYLQEAFNAIVVIQITDDEKFLFRESLTLRKLNEYSVDNIKDILACGFDVDRTFVFRNTDYIGSFYPLILEIQKKVTFNQCKGIFGFTMSDSIGKIAFPAVQAAPSFSRCFPDIFDTNQKIRCLIPQGIDQDPYFRMTRDVAPRLELLKPSLIHSKFFPALQGFGTKMSGSVDQSAIFVTDDDKTIKQKVMKYAFSGGQSSAAEQREKGADLSVDVPYAYLSFFMEDDAKLEEIGKQYASGQLLTGEVKEILVKELESIVQLHKERRSKVTDEILKEISNPHRLSLKLK